MEDLTPWFTGDAEIAYTDSGGDGEPLLLIHGAVTADWFTPLAAEPALRGHRVIRLVRAGYTGAPPPAGLTVGDHARHAAALLGHLGVASAPVFAHSSGCVVALQLALDHPGLVRTLSLCEPPLVDALAAPEDREALGAMFGPIMGLAAAGDLTAAFEAFMTLVCGPDHRRVMAGVLDGEDPYLFTGEMPAVGAWTVDRAALAALRPPTRLIQGGASAPPVHRLVEHVTGMIPGASVVTVDGASHLMPFTHPAELARAIATFHPVAAER
ncbi:hypothetical protein Ade02nite_34450 [Paractinoplanes deccanensis]|uniref:AB hydrolase-1 domain-containing protein n=1 Tax=Paractinoplanes deccanensis TaxID=113561 RepID=A0ABQ3Y484_9ACTN|nr:alpha/beta hydrolase [Actinoplanes deccanensis]GID74804.1 hypothetical protein Ade02nite_34450 [Actinoplanes deccanensis]